MQSFADLIKQINLTKESDFVDIAQTAIEAHYLIPFPNLTDKRPGNINRKYHGGLHVSSTALNVDLLIALYKKYKPELLTNKDGTPLTAQQLKLMQLAAIYHDSANQSEIIGEERLHAEKFQHNMKLLGFTTEELAPFVTAIREKHTDHRDAKESTETTIFQKLLDDADRLDIIRVVRRDFKKNHLTILNQLKDCKGFNEELDQIIENHHETMELFYGEDRQKTQPLHKYCELSSNCYLAVIEAEKNMLKNHIVFECLKRGKLINFNEIDISKLTILDFYNRANSKKVLEIINTLSITTELKEEKKRDKDPVLEMLDHDGALVRALSSINIDEELRTLKTNEDILRQHDLLDPAKLREYMAKQYEQKEVWTPSGFKWRPCSFLKNGIPIELFGGDLAVIIDPNLQKGTASSYFYKRNVLSFTAAAGKFVYDSKTGYRKDKTSFQGIKAKIEEMDKRRRGIEYDPHLHYYGKEKLYWSEILGTYSANSVSGIIVGNTKEAAKAALLLNSKLGPPYRSFYFRKSNTEIIPLTMTEVIQRSGISQKTTLSEREEMLANINSIIQTPVNAFSITEPKTSLEKIPFSDNFPDRTFETELTISYLTCKLTGMDKQTIDKMCHLFDKIKLNTHKSKSNDFQSIEVIKTQDKISLKVSWFGDDDFTLKEINQFINKSLVDINRGLSEKISLTEDKLLTELSDFKIDQLDKIQCDRIPSLENKPIQFEFTHPTQKQIQCVAFVNEAGKPIIQFKLPNGKQLEAETKVLPEIATHYYQMRINELNQLMKNDKIVNYLHKHGIQISQIKLEAHGEKSKLSVKLELIGDIKIEEATNTLVDLLQWKNSKKIKVKTEESTLETSSVSEKIPQKLLLTVPDIQNLDIAIASLKQLIQPPLKFLGKPHIQPTETPMPNPDFPPGLRRDNS